MGSVNGGPLSRDEMALLKYYRALTIQKQLELLENAENTFNATRRMRELAERVFEKGGMDMEGRWN